MCLHKLKAKHLKILNVLEDAYVYKLWHLCLSIATYKFNLSATLLAPK